MHLRRYRSATVLEALALARAELGPDALVLGTRLVAARGPAGWIGRREVELTAALDRTVSAERHVPQPSRHQPAPEDEMVARLTASGVPHDLAVDVASMLPKSERRRAGRFALRDALAERLRPMAAGDEPLAPTEVFVGPPGAGKTSTIAKIAAQERALRGRRVMLVSADGCRIGAIDQLRTYAEVIGIPFAVAVTPERLDGVIGRGVGPVLVDTAGLSRLDESHRSLLARAGERQARVHLVVPATGGAREFQRTLERFAGLRPSRVVVSKVDEAESLAPILGAVRESGLPVSYLATGQRVPEDLTPATPSVLAAWMLGEAAPSAGGA